ncbi:hypothetical protein JTB14_032181 [Gonioctena quinquepunctata]|nr:hypothetical protein JTB14_032181 [Gonioctena quinquepunctata]
MNPIKKTLPLSRLIFNRYFGKQKRPPNAKKLARIKNIQKKFQLDDGQPVWRNFQPTYSLEEEEDILNDIKHVLSVIYDKYAAECKFHDIPDLYRIGKNQNIEKNSRPIVVEFLYYTQITAILKNAHKLKGTKIVITKDYIQEDYLLKKKLHSHLIKIRRTGPHAKISHNKLITNGSSYTIEQLEDSSNASETTHLKGATRNQNIVVAQLIRNQETRNLEVPPRRATRQNSRE